MTGKHLLNTKMKSFLKQIDLITPEKIIQEGRSVWYFKDLLNQVKSVEVDWNFEEIKIKTIYPNVKKEFPQTTTEYLLKRPNSYSWYSSDGTPARDLLKEVKKIIKEINNNPKIVEIKKNESELEEKKKVLRKRKH